MFRTILLVVAGSYLLFSPAAGQEWTEPLTEDVKLLASEGQIAASFGFSIAVIGDTAVISAHGDDDAANNAGAAYFFRWSEEDGEWVEEQKLTASDGAVSDLFAFSIRHDWVKERVTPKWQRIMIPIGQESGFDI